MQENLVPRSPPVASGSFVRAEKVKRRSGGNKSQASLEPAEKGLAIPYCKQISKQWKMPKLGNGKKSHAQHKNWRLNVSEGWKWAMAYGSRGKAKKRNLSVKMNFVQILPDLNTCQPRKLKLGKETLHPQRRQLHTGQQIRGDKLRETQNLHPYLWKLFYIQLLDTGQIIEHTKKKEVWDRQVQRVQNQSPEKTTILHAMANITNQGWLSLCKNRRGNHNRLHCLQEFADAIKMRGAWTKKTTAVAQAKDWKILPSAKKTSQLSRKKKYI